MVTDHIVDIEFGAPERRSPWRIRVAVILGAVALLALAVVVARPTDDADGDPQADDGDTVVGEVVVEIESAGRADGVDSLRMPMIATPNDGLVDGQEILLSASGFGPGATVATVQCAAIPGSIGGENDCDVGNYTLDNANEDGEVALSTTVRRYVSTSSGQVDCANPGGLQCVVAVANISDYDESATADLWFDPTVEGVRGPVIELSATDALNDGDVVTVTGSGFPADAPVVVGECIVGGGWSIIGCWNPSSELARTIADADGRFTVEVEVARVTPDGSDCFGNLYGCRIAARADLTPFTLGDGSATNPVRIWFDGTTPPTDLEWGIAYAMNPDRDLVDGEIVALSLGNLTTTGACVEEELLDSDGEVVAIWADCEEIPLEEGIVLAAQCVDLALGEEYCTDPVELAIVDGTANGEVAVQRFFMRDSGERVDCAEPGRICELRLTGDIAGHVPLRFAGDG